MPSRCTVIFFSCCLAIALMGCGSPAGTYGYSGPEGSELPTGDTAPSGEAGQSDTAAGASCLEIYNAVSVCYSSYYECAGACEDQTCADACQVTYTGCYDAELAQGSGAGQSEFEALRACEEEVYQGCYDQGLELYNPCAEACSDDACLQQCGAQANDALQGCMVEACYGEYSTCGVATEPEEAGNGSSGNTGSGSDTGGSNSESPPSNLSCSQLYECEDACNGNQSCGQDCYDRATGQARGEWTSLIQCGQQMCDGQVVDAAEYRDCLARSCVAEYNVCFGGGSTSGGGTNPGGSTGGTTCGEGYSCVQGCYANSTDETSFYSCVDGCYDVMSSQGTALMNSLVACSNVQCVNVPGSVENYYRCQQDFCPEEYGACVDDTAAATTGADTAQAHATCLEIHEGILAVCVPVHSECVAACTTDDCAQACAQTMDGCIDAQQVGAPDTAVDSFQAMYGCRVDNYQSCYDEANAFYTECTSSCGSGDTACQNACNTGAGTTYEQCFETSCAAEYAACGM